MSKPDHPNLAALIAHYARSEPDKAIVTFVTVGEDGRFLDETRTYGQLYRNGMALARTLQGLGVRPGDSFAIMMANHPEFIEAMIAAAILGAAFVPIDPRTVRDKLGYMLNFAECVGIICGDYCVDAVLELDPRPADLQWLVTLGSRRAGKHGTLRIVDYVSALDSDAPPVEPVETWPDDAMFMMFTSGTTGNPKAVVQSFERYMSQGGAIRGLGVVDTDIFYTGLSLTHINAQGTLRSGLFNAMPVVISRKFTKSRLWDICRAYGCTVFSLLGGMIPEVFATPPKPDDAENPVRLIISAGMPPSLWEAYRQRFGVQICEVYGATEGGGSLFNPPGTGPVGSMGKPPRGIEAVVFNEAGEPCAPFERGELRFRRQDGEATRVTYYKNETASDEKVRDGWYRTGDIVHQDEEGWFYFDHRNGGGVRRNGDFVNTALVESVISQSPLIADVYVYGVPTAHNVAGEKTLVATVVPVDAMTFHADDLLAYCRAQLERNDVPEIVHIVDAIPKTISEKPIERACIELLREQDLIDA